MLKTENHTLPFDLGLLKTDEEGNISFLALR
jgi:hypothetical protein